VTIGLEHSTPTEVCAVLPAGLWIYSHNSIVIITIIILGLHLCTFVYFTLIQLWLRSWFMVDGLRLTVRVKVSCKHSQGSVLIHDCCTGDC